MTFFQYNFTKLVSISLFCTNSFISLEQYTPARQAGIYVRTLVPGEPAAQDGRLSLGDRILAVNGASLVGADYQR